MAGGTTTFGVPKQIEVIHLNLCLDAYESVLAQCFSCFILVDRHFRATLSVMELSLFLLRNRVGAVVKGIVIVKCLPNQTMRLFQMSCSYFSALYQCISHF